MKIKVPVQTSLEWEEDVVLQTLKLGNQVPDFVSAQKTAILGKSINLTRIKRNATVCNIRGAHV